MRYPSFPAFLLVLGPAACNTDDSSPPVGRSQEMLLITPDAEVVGRVTVANSESTLTVTVSTDEGWTLEKARMAVGTELRHIPQTRHGEPIPGRFPLRRKPAKDATETTWRLPLIVEPETSLYFALHADVRKKERKDDDDKNCRVETAWGEGTPFPKLKGSMYFTYTVQSAAPPSLAGLYRTHTQDQWGGDAAADKAAAYLAANFPAAYPLGVTVGTAPDLTARFTTAGAVAAFLPQTGLASALGRNWVNPRGMDNPLAGNVLALELNVGFDAHAPDFAPGVLPLQDLVVADPRHSFFGLTVGEVLSMANQVLSGQSADVVFTPDEINDCVVRINQTFEHGTVDLGFVGLP